MNFPVLTCAQCGSSDVKLMPQRNDLVNCNYCGAIFMIPPPQGEPLPQAIEEPEPEVEEEEKEEEELIIPPVPPRPGTTNTEKFVTFILVVIGFIGAYLILNVTGDDTWLYQLIACIGGLGICSFILLNLGLEKKRKYESSPEMQEYNRVRRQIRERREEREKLKGQTNK
ncbi:hypothetical protein SAMN05444266_106348 [Chitinophaga jiangningensis]|uniref:Uncharacterized protein n=1 Tax=Chitinophaga jiangningensis TaxID=1419482 RepID=A0A1M7G042_9BACT|nr:hypothetical protein [Chitinophaga jiangningensis]SHM09643.1 hypothetical protein SAMN05444266_106348 [Chitinophaga jiangningensis]